MRLVSQLAFFCDCNIGDTLRFGNTTLDENSNLAKIPKIFQILRNDDTSVRVHLKRLETTEMRFYWFSTNKTIQ